MRKRDITEAERRSWDGPLPEQRFQCYWSDAYRERTIEVLRYRARYLVDTTYIFKHFDEYVRQRRSDLQEDKGEVLWNAGYYEKPTDHIRIVAAVENHLKAVLLEQGYMVHYIDSKAPTKHLYAAQQDGRPIRIADYLQLRSFYTDVKQWHPTLDGLRPDGKTITPRHLLGDGMAPMFNLEERFVHLLAGIARERNRIHYLADEVRAYLVEQHIEEWGYLRAQCKALVREKADALLPG